MKKDDQLLAPCAESIVCTPTDAYIADGNIRILKTIVVRHLPYKSVTYGTTAKILLGLDSRVRLNCGLSLRHRSSHSLVELDLLVGVVSILAPI